MCYGVATVVLIHLLTYPGLEAGGIHTRCQLPRGKSKDSWEVKEGILAWKEKQGHTLFLTQPWGKHFISLVFEGPCRAGLAGKIKSCSRVSLKGVVRHDSGDNPPDFHLNSMPPSAGSKRGRVWWVHLGCHGPPAFLTKPDPSWRYQECL